VEGELVVPDPDGNGGRKAGEVNLREVVLVEYKNVDLVLLREQERVGTGGSFGMQQDGLHLLGGELLHPVVPGAGEIGDGYFEQAVLHP